MYLATIASLDSLICGSTVGYPSDSLASCTNVETFKIPNKYYSSLTDSMVFAHEIVIRYWHLYQ